MMHGNAAGNILCGACLMIPMRTEIAVARIKPGLFGLMQAMDASEAFLICSSAAVSTEIAGTAFWCVFPGAIGGDICGCHVPWNPVGLVQGRWV